jgi:hypothetical protein
VRGRIQPGSFLVRGREDRDGRVPGLAPRLGVTRRRVALGFFAVLVLALGFAYTQRDAYSDDAAELSRSLIGDENTARLEGWYFALQDRVDRWKYSVFGGSTTPSRTACDRSPAR